MTERTYTVVCNDEEQYALWDVDRVAPPGWHPVGFSGSRSACVAHVDRQWTDLRPRSARTSPDPGSDTGSDTATGPATGAGE